MKTSSIRASYRGITEPKVKARWQKSISALQVYNQEEQINLLNQFVFKMGLSESNPHPGYYNIIEEVTNIYHKIDLLKKLGGKKGPNLSAISRMFLDVFQGISAYSEDQKKGLNDFIETKADLPPERILLPQTLKAVSLWLKKSQLS